MKNIILSLIIFLLTSTAAFAQVKAQAISAEQLKASAKFEKLFPPPPTATTVRISSITIDVLNSKLTVRYEIGYVEGDGDFVNTSYGEQSFLNDESGNHFDEIMKGVALDMDKLIFELNTWI